VQAAIKVSTDETNIRPGRSQTKLNQTDLWRTVMKKFAIAALAALVATVSLSSVAEAGWRWRHHGWHHGWHGHWWGGPRIVIRPAYYDDVCFVRKVARHDRWGNVYIKRIRVCG
jgi:hypothetical protein